MASAALNRSEGAEMDRLATPGVSGPDLGLELRFILMLTFSYFCLLLSTDFLKYFRASVIIALDYSDRGVNK